MNCKSNGMPQHSDAKWSHDKMDGNTTQYFIEEQMQIDKKMLSPKKLPQVIRPGCRASTIKRLIISPT
jgi:hypothetical protein